VLCAVGPVDVVRRQGDEVLSRGPGVAGGGVVGVRPLLLGPGMSVRPLRPAELTAPRAPPGMGGLTGGGRARLVAFVESNEGMPAEAKARVLTRLQADRVPAQMVSRLESRMGG